VGEWVGGQHAPVDDALALRGLLAFPSGEHYANQSALSVERVRCMHLCVMQ